MVEDDALLTERIAICFAHAVGQVMHPAHPQARKGRRRLPWHEGLVPLVDGVIPPFEAILKCGLPEDMLFHIPALTPPPRLTTDPCNLRVRKNLVPERLRSRRCRAIPKNTEPSRLLGSCRRRCEASRKYAALHAGNSLRRSLLREAQGCGLPDPTIHSARSRIGVAR